MGSFVWPLPLSFSIRENLSQLIKTVQLKKQFPKKKNLRLYRVNQITYFAQIFRIHETTELKKKKKINPSRL